MSPVPGADRQDGRRFLQPHGLCHLRIRVLLAVHEGDQRSALPEPVRLHLLGQEAMVAQKEAPVAAGNAGGGPARDCPGRRHRRARHDHRLVLPYFICVSASP